jgi:HPt (histidine-containing phosphotransfer) domain-containing protein
MEFNNQYNFINLESLLQIAHGDKSRMEKYLKQFVELIPVRMDRLRDSLEKKDRAMIRQVVHNMAPQLLFFGLPDIEAPIQSLELKYQAMPMTELLEITNKILYSTGKALEEIRQIVESNQ